MCSAAVCRTAGQKQQREEAISFSDENIDQLVLVGCHALPINGREKGAYFQTDLAREVRFVGNGHASADGVGLWNPVLSCNVNVGYRRIIEDEEVWVKPAHGWRQGKCGGVGDGLSVLAETQKNPHRLGPKPICGAQGQSHRFAATEDQFPDMIV